MTVLIVEDNASVRRLIRNIVIRMAERIHECGDGAAALAAYLEYRPDVVLTDIEMKELDGIAATMRIKTAHPAANIIIVTDYDDTELREAARDAGACGYVLKHSLLESTISYKPWSNSNSAGIAETTKLQTLYRCNSCR